MGQRLQQQSLARGSTGGHGHSCHHQGLGLQGWLPAQPPFRLGYGHRPPYGRHNVKQRRGDRFPPKLCPPSPSPAVPPKHPAPALSPPPRVLCTQHPAPSPSSHLLLHPAALCTPQTMFLLWRPHLPLPPSVPTGSLPWPASSCPSQHPKHGSPHIYLHPPRLPQPVFLPPYPASEPHTRSPPASQHSCPKTSPPCRYLG